MSSAEWIGAATVTALLALVLWRAGAMPRQIAFVTVALVLGILATAAIWDFFESHD